MMKGVERDLKRNEGWTVNESIEGRTIPFMTRERVLGNDKGFTLIEIIAVLVILGILAAVAVPKYVSLQSDAAAKAAQAEVAEIKGTLNLGWAKAVLVNGSTSGVTINDVITNAGLTAGAGNTVGTAPDIWNYDLTAAGSKASITINSRNSDTSYTATGSWHLPQ